MGNRLPWQQEDISISQLSEDVEGQDLVQVEVKIDLKSNFCVWLLGQISCHGNKMKVSISAILRHRKLKFGIQIVLGLRNEFRWLLGGFGYHGNTNVSSCQPLWNIQLLNIECSNCACRSFMVFLNLVAR